MKLNFYPVIYPNGDMAEVREEPGNLYEAITEKVGSPFDMAILSPGLGCILRDNGLLDGSDPNIPMMLVFGAPLCGPVMLVGPTDHDGNSTPPVLPEEMLMTLTMICNRLHMVHQQIDQNRDTPFTITEIADFDSFLGGMCDE